MDWPAAGPDLQVEKARDVVILTDGTKVIGTIIAAGQKRIMIIEDGASTERVINRSDVESYRRGPSERRTVGYRVEKDTFRGVLTLKEDDGTVPAGGGGAAPSRDTSPVSKPGTGIKPDAAKPEPAARVDLTPLWKMLEGKPSADDIAAAFIKNPGWAAQINRLVKSGRVPPEGARALEAVKARCSSDPAFVAGLAKVVMQNKLPVEVMEILKAR